MLALMGEMEGHISGGVHYDNVAPCYLGGMQLMIEERGIISQQIPGFDKWLWCWPIRALRSLPPKRARFFPAQYRRQDCIAHGRHLAGFIPRLL